MSSASEMARSHNSSSSNNNNNNNNNNGAIHQVLGGGQVADILLWRVPEKSSVVLISFTIIWLLFEVFKYNFITLVCHISMTTMLISFIWCTLTETFKWKKPEIPEVIMDQTTFEQAAILFHARFNQYLAMLLNIACGKDIRLFFLTIWCLLSFSILGKYISSLNLLFISYICVQVLPFLYEKYEDNVNYIAGEIYQTLKNLYKKIDECILAKLPKGSPIDDRKKK